MPIIKGLRENGTTMWQTSCSGDIHLARARKSPFDITGIRLPPDAPAGVGKLIRQTIAYRGMVVIDSDGRGNMTSRLPNYRVIHHCTLPRITATFLRITHHPARRAVPPLVRG